jgi:hypothetical protein
MPPEQMFDLAKPGLIATAKSYNVLLTDSQIELVKQSYLDYILEHGTSRGWLIKVFRPWLGNRMLEKVANGIEGCDEKRYQ